ncbi:MAG: Naphthalene 1,2-dioxygenase/salicylate 5-hydroxylase systems, ferredoxin component [candidate division WS2 bacterium]|uniref:Naphthalene 1,2-dioxygenase/salicylate 5-hydroxylase systems, ferredoxin component n=1 Tax=Psychracetigena formicireducens TaxID=2986056 RepID=A0A9E2BI43_PSYF1|nr:Naphthalene 1,2-dioxygenase/salicylate 5-hydroxylase systems, ferredoxin component [Candidatus Psychracetigena formicireducens]MBT9144565.1 Naphthalene 1,2-dioxygenase/salicylate 5-hydroxylase systems, ferredoxin component [Candidatus Psychracetigena formicireducens]MBT9151658.1 Naphthalene 1,2-dioxygenase/salicylate 5-hydroxylase systems, ferredoxin component [Candidatus Psychracetigena formicireducens]
MSKWIYALQAEQLPEGKTSAVKVGGQSILLARVAGHVYALHNECPHLGCPLHRGRLDGFLLQCPCHDWVFDLRSGEFTIAPEIKIPVFPVREERGEILLKTGGE